MFIVNEQIQILETEFTWTFARSGGPGGQNVNKVASKALLRFDLAKSTAVPDEVKIRLALQHKRYFTIEGELVITSQRYRDQDRNRDDCLEKLRAIIVQALFVPKARKATRPSRSSKRRRLETKRQRGETKRGRKKPSED